MAAGRDSHTGNEEKPEASNKERSHGGWSRSSELWTRDRTCELSTYLGMHMHVCTSVNAKAGRHGSEIDPGIHKSLHSLAVGAVGHGLFPGASNSPFGTGAIPRQRPAQSHPIHTYICTQTQLSACSLSSSLRSQLYEFIDPLPTTNTLGYPSSWSSRPG